MFNVGWFAATCPTRIDQQSEPEQEQPAVRWQILNHLLDEHEWLVHKLDLDTEQNREQAIFALEKLNTLYLLIWREMLLQLEIVSLHLCTSRKDLCKSKFLLKKKIALQNSIAGRVNSSVFCIQWGATGHRLDTTGLLIGFMTNK